MASVSQKTTLGNNSVANRDSDALAEVIHSRDSGFDRSNMSIKGTQIMPVARTSHPLNPLTAAEISVAVGTVRASGQTPEIRDGMRFIEVALLEPEKHVVALADAYFFPPFQSSLAPRTKGVLVIPSKLPPRQARLIVYNKKSNETSIWVVELSEVHAATRGGHHRGKVISSHVVPEVQPAMVESWRASNKVKIKYELLRQFVGIAHDLSSLQFCIKKISFLFLFLNFLIFS